MDKGLQVDVIYTDFAKAFDKLNIDILLKKVTFYDIGGYIHNWFESYLFIPRSVD